MTITYYVLKAFLMGWYYFMIGVSIWVFTKLIWCIVMTYVIEPIKLTVEAVMEYRNELQKTTE